MTYNAQPPRHGAPHDGNIPIRAARTICDTLSEMPVDSAKAKKVKDRRQRRSMKDTKRTVLLNLIANEMSNAWLGEDQLEGTEGCNTLSPETTLTAEDIFYAQINGESIDVPAPVQDIGNAQNSTSTLHGADDSDDNCSFGGLTLPDNVRSTPTERISSKSLHSTSSRSSTSESFRPTRPRKELSSSSHSSSKSWELSPSEHSKDSGSSDAETISLDEIQNHIMNNMPPEVLEKIPRDAWSRIFGTGSPDKIHKVRSAKAKNRLSDIKVIKKTSEEDTENDTVVSDITGSTRFGRKSGSDSVCAIVPEAAAPAPPPPPPPQDDVDNLPSTEPTEQAPNTLPDNASVTQRSVGPVTFSFVQVRNYERIMDVNPAVSSGPAIGIGWNYKRGGMMSVDDWEVHRGSNSRRSRELILPREAREEMLRELGYDQKQIAEAIRHIRKAKDRRRVTVQNLGAAEALEATVEAASRRLIGILNLGRKKGLAYKN